MRMRLLSPCPLLSLLPAPLRLGLSTHCAPPARLTRSNVSLVRIPFQLPLGFLPFTLTFRSRFFSLGSCDFFILKRRFGFVCFSYVSFLFDGFVCGGASPRSRPRWGIHPRGGARRPRGQWQQLKRKRIRTRGEIIAPWPVWNHQNNRLVLKLNCTYFQNISCHEAHPEIFSGQRRGEESAIILQLKYLKIPISQYYTIDWLIQN